VLDRLYRLITPLPRSAWDDGWPYGRALRRYDVEGAIRAEPGVLYTNRVELIAEDMPEVRSPRSRSTSISQGCVRRVRLQLYRTVNGETAGAAPRFLDGRGSSADEKVEKVRCSRTHPGRVAW